MGSADVKKPESLIDFYVEYLENIDFSKSRVAFPTKHMVLVCGGQVPKENGSLTGVNIQNIEKENFASLREAFCKVCLQNYKTPFNMFMPEDMKSWQDHDLFNDLVEMEVMLAYACSIILIFLESSGSLVELGVFSQLNEFHGRVLVINDNEFEAANSFISLGALSYLRRRNEHSVCLYPRVSDCGVVTEETMSFIIGDVNEYLKGLNKNEKFDAKNKFHYLIFILEVIKIFRALTIKEILDFAKLSFLEFPEIEADGKFIEKGLRVLIEFNVLENKTLGSYVFYILSSEKDFYRIKFHYKDENDGDFARLRSDIIDFYRNSSESAHSKRLKSIKGLNEVSEEFF